MRIYSFPVLFGRKAESQFGIYLFINKPVASLKRSDGSISCGHRHPFMQCVYISFFWRWKFESVGIGFIIGVYLYVLVDREENEHRVESKLSSVWFY